MEKPQLCPIVFFCPITFVGGDWGAGVLAGGRCTFSGAPSPLPPGSLEGHVAWDRGEQSVRERRPAGRRLQPGPPSGCPEADSSQVGIHHFYVDVQILNKEVIILPSLYHAFYELVRRLII